MGEKIIRAIVFDLDGVICSTDECHYEAWKVIADGEGIPFDKTVNDRLRGISRFDSLNILLEKAKRVYSEKEKADLCEKKNELYRSFLKSMSPASVSEDVLYTLEELQKRKIPFAIGSSSKNTKLILERVGLQDAFAAIADGTEISHSKPDPEVFLLAARKLGAEPHTTLVVEDAESGLLAAKRGGFRSAGIGPSEKSPLADYSLSKLSDILSLL